MGYVVSENRREPDSNKIAVIDGLATPTNGIAKLLEHVGWYRELITDFANTAVPNTQLVKKDCKFVWTKACQKAFKELMWRLNIYLVLRPLNCGKSFLMFCDASNVAVCSALC